MITAVFLIAGPSLLDGVHHQTECDGLLVQEHKLLPIGKLFRHNSEELARWRRRRPQQPVGVRGARNAGVKSRPKEVDEPAPVGPGEQSPTLRLWVTAETQSNVRRGVVQAGGAGDRVALIVQRAGEVNEVVAVPLDLCDGMKSRPAKRARHAHQFARQVVGRRITPLLEFDHDVGRCAGARVPPCQNDIGTFAGERELVLEQHLDVVQSGVNQILGEDRQAAGPGSRLCGRGPAARSVAQRLRQPCLQF